MSDYTECESRDFCDARSEELSEARADIDRLRSENDKMREAIKAHNDGCESACKWKYVNGSCAYRNKDGAFRYHQTRCSDCPEHGVIEVPEGAAK